MKWQWKLAKYNIKSNSLRGLFVNIKIKFTPQGSIYLQEIKTWIMISTLFLQNPHLSVVLILFSGSIQQEEFCAKF